MISGSTVVIFTKFLPYGRYLIVDSRFDFLFSDGLRNVAMATNFRVKMAKSDYTLLFVVLAFRNGLQCRHPNFKKVYL